MDPSPPAWLRSYKAHSSMIPNYASHVRPSENDSATTKPAPEPSLRTGQNERLTEHDNSESAEANPFAFPSTISLTLHTAGSLDKTYTNSTPEPSSPQKADFNSGCDEKPATERALPLSASPSKNHRRGPLCRFLAAIRALLKSKTQNKLPH